MITLWSGFHSKELLPLLRTSWEQNDLFILCPPHLQDFDFINCLPAGEIVLTGHLNSLPQKLNQTQSISRSQFVDTPVIGVFTSGTISGKPRLCLYSKKNILASLDGVRSFFDLNQYDEFFCYPQPFHTFGLTLGYLQSIIYDLKLTAPDGKYSSTTHALRSENNNPKLLTLGAPAHFYDLNEFVLKNNLKLNPTYSCIVGGAKVSVPLWNKIKNNLHIKMPSIGYGATEACPGITHQPPGLAPIEEGEIGFPLPNVSIELIPNLGLKFKGPNTCLAIIENQTITFPKEILIKDEITKRASDGVFVYQGRCELLLNRGGTKFSLEAIEELINREFNLRSVCFSIPDERLGEDLGVLIEAPSQLGLNLRDKIKSVLSTHFHQNFNLETFNVTEKLKLNSSGKIDRKR